MTALWLRHLNGIFRVSFVSRLFTHCLVTTRCQHSTWCSVVSRKWCIHQHLSTLDIKYSSLCSRTRWCLTHSSCFQAQFGLRQLNATLVKHRLSKRNFSSVAKPSLSFESDSLLMKYLNSLSEQYSKVQQEVEKLLESGKFGDTEQPQQKVDQLNRDLLKLEPIVNLVCQHRQQADELNQLNDIINESSGKDDDLCRMARNDLSNIQDLLSQTESKILDCLVPPMIGDRNDIILEVSAGVGGQEAMLFTKELFDMYISYAHYKGWTTENVDFELSDLGGTRHAMTCISGQNVFMRMKFEGGVHRVQRVPRTEKSGRIHTSTATVAVMAQPSEVDIVINPKDLRINTFRAGGKGGQHVNTTDSAVRIVHLPTGTTAECQSERSQLRNRETAMNVLRTRLYEKEMEANLREQSTCRKLQIGSASRSEKIRTYNAKDDRITDHRLNDNVYGVQGVLTGGEQLDELMDMLQAESRRERLLELIQLRLDS